MQKLPVLHRYLVMQKLPVLVIDPVMQWTISESMNFKVLSRLIWLTSSLRGLGQRLRLAIGTRLGKGITLALEVGLGLGLGEKQASTLDISLILRWSHQI